MSISSKLLFLICCGSCVFWLFYIFVNPGILRHGSTVAAVTNKLLNSAISMKNSSSNLNLHWNERAALEKNFTISAASLENPTSKMVPQNSNLENCSELEIDFLDKQIPVVYCQPSYANLSKMFGYLEPGGHNKPSNCTSGDRVAVIIPYRDRDSQLRDFLYHMHNFLRRQNLDYAIFVVEQISNQTFNRGKLLNIGALEATKFYEWDCLIFHDVDLLPESDKNLYSCPAQPRHMSVAVSTLHYRLPHRGIFGGVTALQLKHFYKLNGYSNEYWGWGGEDSDMNVRIHVHLLKVERRDSQIARYKMVKHDREKDNAINRCRWKFRNPTAKHRWRKDGLNSLNYTMIKAVFVGNLYTKELFTTLSIFNQSIVLTLTEFRIYIGLF